MCHSIAARKASKNYSFFCNFFGGTFKYLTTCIAQTALVKKFICSADAYLKEKLSRKQVDWIVI